MSLKRLYALFVSRNMEFFRDRTALGWNLLMPVLLVLGFSYAFNAGDTNLYKVGVVQTDAAALQAKGPFFELKHIQFIPMTEASKAVTKVERHQIDLVVEPAAGRYWINDQSDKGYMAERLLLGSVATGANHWQKQSVSSSQIRYVDWVIPGILGMNIMFSALYGVGYVIVRYRKNGVLKRLRATPLSALEFLIAQLASRLWITIAVGIGIYAALNLMLGFTMHGNYLTLLLVFVFGIFNLISLGLIIASRLATEEVADGLLNLISWPMMFLSGVWFSLEGAHPIMQKIALIFPLTHVTNAARKVMLDGAGLVDIAPQLLTLGIMGAVFLTIGAMLFRWES